MTGFAPLLAALALAQGSPTPEAPAAETPAAATDGSTPTKAPAATAIATPTAPKPKPRIDPAADRAEAERAARAFLDALVAGDPAALAAAASERFSFDGDVVSGRDAIRATWRSLLAGRPGPAPRVARVEVLPAADAVTRLGKPPARVAPLVRPGAFVAIADVGGRPVVLFVAREGGRVAVLGMHD